MMKKIACFALGAAIAASCTLSLAACNKKTNDSSTLNIVCLNAGYGKEWITTIAKKFEEENEGYKVNLSNCIYEAGTLINKDIYSKNNTDDLYICVGSEWKVYAAQGKLANLDDFINETVDGVTIKEKVSVEYSNSIYFPDSSGDLHTYRLPWTAGYGGIYYNATMFEENNWEIPTTYSELVTLCQTIKDANVETSSSGNKAEYVKPFVYTAANIDYFDYTVYTWWAQLAGEDAVKEFMTYSSSSSYDSTQNETYAKLKEATKLWYDLMGDSSNTLTYQSNHDAQTAFNNGKAAMMFNGDWLYNEIIDYQINNDFTLGVMATPTAPNAVQTNITYTIGEDQYIAIPSSSSKQELAKKFIKLMISDYGCQVFAEQAHGLLAYKSNLTSSSVDDYFMKNLITVKNSYTTAFTDYPTITLGTNYKNNTRMLWFSNLINIWGTSALRPYDKVTGSNAKSIDSAFSDISSEVSRQWSTWKKNAGIK